MRRGEVPWAELPAPAGRRPVLFISRDRAYRVRMSVTFAVVTRTIRGIPTEVRLGPEDGMPATCVVNADNLMTAPKSLLTDRITALSSRKMAAADAAIQFALDIR